jgi:hypothetical protein
MRHQSNASSLSWVARSFALILAVSSLSPMDEGFQGMPKTASSELAQALGSHCATPVGVCQIAPQPIGSPCACGQYWGTTVF